MHNIYSFLNNFIIISKISFIRILYFPSISQLIYQLTNLFQVIHCCIKFMRIQRSHFINRLNFRLFLSHLNKLFLAKVILLWFFINLTPIITKVSQYFILCIFFILFHVFKHTNLNFVLFCLFLQILLIFQLDFRFFTLIGQHKK